MAAKPLKIVNARENNLKGLNLEIEHDCLTVLTGPSGSGKSSLAFNTVYAEGQRRYIETFSPYTRQFFDKAKRPNLDLIENTRPSIAIQQKTSIKSSRSTVGTMTDINAYLGILWSNLSQPVCPVCKVRFDQRTPARVAEYLSFRTKLSQEKIFLICAPRKIGGYKTTSKAIFRNRLTGELERLKKLGAVRYFDPQSAEIKFLEESEYPALDDRGRLLVVVDRTDFKRFNQKRIEKVTGQAFSISKGECLIIDPRPLRRSWLRVINCPGQHNLKAGRYSEESFSAGRTCSFSKVKIAKRRPSLFSFNSPVGACETCRGFGYILTIDPDLCVPDKSLSIKDGAVHCWNGPKSARLKSRLLAFCRTKKIPVTKPWRDLSKKQQHLVFESKERSYTGIYPWFKKKERKIYKPHIRIFFSKYRSRKICPECSGKRLKNSSLAYKINGKTIADIRSMTADRALSWLQDLKKGSKDSQFSEKIRDLISTITDRLHFLCNLGLPYLTLDREGRTLSGGETQRVNLAAALGSGLVSTQFVFDEPTVGLHQRDTKRLIDSIGTLADSGNSVLMVEHDPECICAASRIIELGPSSGAKGGEVVYQGLASGREIFKISPVKVKKTSLKGIFSRGSLKIRGAGVRNLKNIDIDIPLERLTCLTGVSGSGKSTLVEEVIVRAYNDWKAGINRDNVPYQVSGFRHLDQVLPVNQAPLAKSPRANIATYTGIWERLRTIMSRSEEAKLMGLTKSHFSFNSPAGRCPHCRGAGFIKEDMQFLSDVYLQCEVCLGKRFKEEVLEITHQQRNVYDLLQLSIDECAEVFSADQKILNAAAILSELGLGYLSLGHPLSELSGGEAQRLKLVPFIERSKRGKSLLIFDEPTTGLHMEGVQNMISLFHKLCSLGHTVLCIEHNLAVVAQSHWVIDLGPEGGEAGGYLLFAGTPAELKKASETRNLGQNSTASALKEFEGFLYGNNKIKKQNLTQKTKPSAYSGNTFPLNLEIKGARSHNLKNTDISIPLNKVTAITGVSGSGKSTIAKDIVYAEGQRRYLDCLSPYARQYIRQLSKPDADRIKNIPPAICVHQHTFQPGPLSTVGTVSEIYPFLRLLYAKAGVQYCPQHPKERASPASLLEIASDIRDIDSRIKLLAPVVRNRKGIHREIFTRAVALDISRVRVDGMLGKPSQYLEGLKKEKNHTIEYETASFTPASVEESLVLEALKDTFRIGGGELIIEFSGQEKSYSLSRRCPECGRGFFKPDPEDLSFHSPRGRCSLCRGRGKDSGGQICPECRGSRISEPGRYLRLNGKNIHEASKLNPSEMLSFLNSLREKNLNAELLAPILREIREKTQVLIELGLSSLPLSRECSQISTGELQRLKVASVISSPLSGVMYIFDEPSAGLHPYDNEKVIRIIKRLKEKGNSVLLIEHDLDAVLSSDHVIEVGPGGGKEGGKVIFSGNIKQLKAFRDSPTSQALAESVMEKPASSSFSFKESLFVKSSGKHNLKPFKITLPLGALITVAGVSGAGKSTLVHEIIETIFKTGKRRGLIRQSGGDYLKSTAEINRVLTVDQKPIGKTSRSTPASYLGIWDDIRKVYATSCEAAANGWKAGFFSYNTGKGRCPECSGRGTIKLEMSFLPDASVACEACSQSRYSDEARSIQYRGLSIADALNLTFEEALKHFINHPAIHRIASCVCEIGLGYLTLGQTSSTLSGGESQRLKLAVELSKRPSGLTLYLLDEPTTGLHRKDVKKLINVLKILTKRGDTVIAIEHDRQFICRSDYLIELGPGSGDQGGEIIFEGAPGSLDTGTPWGKLLTPGVLKEAV